jgi:hypothetical protein
VAFTGPYPTKFSGNTPAMVISHTTFSGGVTNAGTIGAGGISVVNSKFLTGSLVDTGLISGAPVGFFVSASTIHGSIVDSGAISAGSAGIHVDSGAISAGSAGIHVDSAVVLGGIGSGGTVSAGDQGIFIGSFTQTLAVKVFAGGINNSGRIMAGTTGISVDSVATFLGGINNRGTISEAGSGGNAILVDRVTSFMGGIVNSGTISAGGGLGVFGILITGVNTFSGGKRRELVRRSRLSGPRIPSAASPSPAARLLRSRTTPR